MFYFTEFSFVFLSFRTKAIKTKHLPAALYSDKDHLFTINTHHYVHTQLICLYTTQLINPVNTQLINYACTNNLIKSCHTARLLVINK